MPSLQRLFADLTPGRKLLEVGCYEGRSTTWFIQHALSGPEGGAIWCVDPWAEEYEEGDEFWRAVEGRFDRNIALATGGRPGVAVHKRKGRSVHQLAALIADGHAESFDFAYIDGNHHACEVLTDCILAFELVRAGGVIVCDDYRWRISDNPLHSPKLAIDAFAGVFLDKVTQSMDPQRSQVRFLKTESRTSPEWNREFMRLVWSTSPNQIDLDSAGGD
ncbi:MAG: class I SAM-dependent methyltransferase [Planctomycetota bacterium]